MHSILDTGRARLTLLQSNRAIDHASFAADVRAGLSAKCKHLPSRYLYDHAGSQLFAKICELPEYYLTRAEREILQTQAGEIARVLSHNTVLVELGSGNSEKTRILIREFLDRHGALEYLPIDVSRETLTDNALDMIDSFSDLHVTAIVAEYREGLRRVREEVSGPKCVLFLGSSIGNFDRGEATRFLRELAESLDGEDRLLVGIDLRKDAEVLEAAYDDSRGVTASFNRNLLTRINRELGGHFDIKLFRHAVRYDTAAGNVQSDLISTTPQKVAIDSLRMTVSFDEGEAIHTEDSFKYSIEEVDALAADCSLRTERRWFDSKRHFSLNLFAPLISPAC